MNDLSTLISGLAIRHAGGPREITPKHLTDDSRRIEPGDLFIARSGTTESGEKYIADAVRRGAAAVIAAELIETEPGVSFWVADDPAAITAELAERFYDRPSHRLTLIGVTGTNGKTTVAYMVRHLLNATDRKCGMMTTVEIDDGLSCRPAELTTPGACEISRTLAQMVAAGCEACVMEASSHALDQGRCDALDFDIGVFTNLTGDHLDYHGSMEAYAAAKAKLLQQARACVVNADDEWTPRLVDTTSDHVMGFHIGPVRQGSLWNAELKSTEIHGTHIVMHGFDDSPRELTLPMLGQHNVYNLLAAWGAANLSGVGIEALRDSIETMQGAPGRLERVSSPDHPFTVLVDYAHTDDALRNVLGALRPIVPEGGRLHLLFGCGGDRDPTKRPRMAQVACELADAIIITSDNPRTEDPAVIIDDIMAGVSDTDRSRVHRIEDRAEAIEAIIRSVRANDVILLAGKGHEDYQVIGTEKTRFDDREQARRVLETIA